MAGLTRLRWWETECRIHRQRRRTENVAGSGDRKEAERHARLGSDRHCDISD